MASLSMVLSGRISAPSSTTSSQSNHSTEIVKETKDPSKSNSSSRKTSERLTSAELAPAFKIGREPPSIYLYSNYNFQKLQRELKIITPHYTPSSATPTFTLVDKTQTLERKGHELPPGLRFPQGHVYQNQLILTGTLIMPGKAPTLALYAFNLSLDKWEKLDTDTTLLTGSWNRTVLHPATGTLLIFGHRESNAEADYSSRIQHHDHLMSINLQAYGLYERPIPSFLPTAQDLGQDMLREPGLNDMHLVSASGTLFGANSTILAARWPEFSTMLLSPPYVTPLILVLPVPDEVISVFLHYLYTGALPLHTVITPGMADYLLILARRYQLNGLHALTIDLLHQGVVANPVRIYSSALLAGELGLQARAVGLAMTALPAKPPTSRPSSSLSNPATMPGANAMTPSMPPPLSARRRPSMQPQILDSSLSRSYSNRVPPPSSRPPVTPERRQRAPSQHSRDSMSTDGGIVGESLSQQYNPSTIVDGGRLTPTVYMSSPEPGLTGPNSSRQRKLRTPPTPSNFQQSAFSQHPMSFISTSSGGSNYDSPMASPVLARGPQILQQYQQAYPSPLSPSSQQMPSFASYGGHIRGSGPGSDGGAPSVYSHDDQDERGDLRAQQAKRRLHMQMQMQMQSEMDLQQQVLVEQQHMRDEEIMLQQRSLRQQQQQQQQRGKPEVEPVVYHNPAAAMMGALDHHMGGSYANSSNQSTKSSKGGSHYPSSQMTAETQLTIGTESTVETVSSRKSGSSKATSVKSSGSDEKKKGLLSKMKPPKPKASGAALMKSAGF
ncbi:hypothetical protein EDD11_004429 [Mortierella claussenii]|nr:hypothetical protein EDD11_004429 [Mortierella claussenii]